LDYYQYSDNFFNEHIYDKHDNDNYYGGDNFDQYDNTDDDCAAEYSSD
jgi:hypothetical protein